MKRPKINEKEDGVGPLLLKKKLYDLCLNPEAINAVSGIHLELPVASSPLHIVAISSQRRHASRETWDQYCKTFLDYNFRLLSR